MELGARSYRAVILLGAGATRGAFTGIGRAKIRPPLNRDFFVVARKLAKTTAGRRYRSAVKRLDKFVANEMRFHRGAPPTMEEVFNVLFMSKDLPRIFFGRGKPRNAGHRQEIDDFISLVVGVLRYVQENPRHRSGVDHYERLAARLQPGDALVCLNYDTTMDNALAARGWNARTGYGFELNAKKVRIIDNFPRGPALRDVLLLKPHGSLNWFSKGSIRHFEKVLDGRRPPNVEMTHVPKANVKKGYVRLFIPPLYVKFFANPFWRRLWDKSFARLHEAQVLVIVGCSLIQTDFHLRSIVGAAVASRRVKFKRIVIVEPSADVRRRLKTFLRGRGEKVVVYQDFTAFVRSL